ncbi:fatty acyl-AMP ligase [Streptomyces sp. NPDC094144]|uniref:fatty acyl-AMP ligase n=1 Tax=Streptomyces sp. NPDC094144 TaxID=3366056 RepID=UPI003821D85A
MDSPTAQPLAGTLIDVLVERARGVTAGLPLFTALDSGGDPTDRVSAAALLGRVRAVAAALRTVGAAGDRVVVPALPGLDFHAGFLGCLYAGMIAVPVPPLRTGARHRATVRNDRLEKILRDCAPVAVLVSTPEDAEDARRADADAGAGPEPVPARIAVRQPADQGTPGPARTASDPAAVALLQYTSGSTGDPRGVIVGHGSLVANQRAVRDRCEIGPETTVVSWLPLFHDMGLCTGLVLPLVSGAAAVTMEPATFVRDPRVWLRAIEAEEDVFAAAPDFAYELCVRRIPEAERAGTDLSTWRVAANGSEPVKASTLRRFAEAFRPSFFREEVFSPGYGLAESTLIVTMGKPLFPAPVRHYERAALAEGKAVPATPSAGTVELVGCGTAVTGAAVRVVDPETRRPLAERMVGEIWVDAPGNCAGYWRNEAGSAKVFGARTEGAVPGTEGTEGNHVRTGDLGFLEEGELFVTGRLKDVLIIGGENYFPQDVEAVAGEAHAAFAYQRAAAWPLDEERNGVAVVIETAERDQEVLAGAVRAAGMAVARALPAPVSVFAVARNKVPRTTSGKIRRRACAQQVAAGQLRPLAQWSSR